MSKNNIHLIKWERAEEVLRKWKDVVIDVIITEPVYVSEGF